MGPEQLLKNPWASDTVGPHTEWHWEHTEGLSQGSGDRERARPGTESQRSNLVGGRGSHGKLEGKARPEIGS